MELYITANTLIINVLKDVGKGQSFKLAESFFILKIKQINHSSPQAPPHYDTSFHP